MLERLKPYRSCSWDFDGTLVNHPMSPLMWDFIITNPYRQQHSIITMRSHGMEDFIFPLLEYLGSTLTRDHFVHVLNVPDDIYADYCVSGSPTHDYCAWKGRMCREIGADILIDDMEGYSVSLLGCTLYGIPHIHPDDLVL